jgi:hypothetical protein
VYPTLSDFVVEKALALVYFILLIAAGVFFYWLRSRCLVLYGLSEIAVALLLMFQWCWPHGALTHALLGQELTFLDKLLPNLLTWFVGVYAFVRGCDNFVTGARSVRDF